MVSLVKILVVLHCFKARENMSDTALGPSSNIAFLRHISRAIARGNAHTPDVPSLSSPSQTGGGMLNVSTFRSSDDSRSRGQALSKNEVNIFALPSEDRTWSLIQIYFEKTGQLLPFIHEASFCETYFRMRADNFKRVRRTWLGLLNIVLAISTSLHTEGDLPAGRRIEESDIYFQRANGLCDRDSKRNATLEMGIKRPPLKIYRHALIDDNSPILVGSGPISSRNPKVGTGVDHPWTGYFSCFSAWLAFSRGQPALLPLGQ